ncbi:glycosyltransferase family 4 protein [Leptospira johnsonii]|uniref:Group 1 glycosyl transferase n=1 Tax=Leptospira johnsonii TaxID=1917820 RepID=A0A2P2D1J2_9LEPT|nr:glycosyltransferase family 4 protein [Leptospira johnsonii]GBF38519.1 group 1 glycosyl transferase [Leptospira johnsonii]
MEYSPELSTLNRIAFIGNYLPRQCGIATFTTDLCEAFSETYSEIACIALPVNDTDSGYPYPPIVRFELTEKDIASYHRAADFLNVNNVDIVCLQFEYGIFGGKSGSHIIALLRDLHMPIVTTLHTILQEPDPDQRKVLEQIAAISDRLVVMSKRGAELLTAVYGIQKDKIDLIPHGIPDVPFVDPSFNKDMFGVEGKIVLLSFGLLSPNKGIENVISALPSILKKHENVVYIILGATHPHVIRNEGETYRLSLQWLAREKKVEGNVIFYNRFVSLKELIEFIGATDIYITPYLDSAQIVSGTLAYTVGAGKAVISTPYSYAQEMLAEERGMLVPFKDPEGLADQVIQLLDNEAERHAMRKRAYIYGRSMIWPKVASRYKESFERAKAERRHFSPPGFPIKPLDKRPEELPLLKLDHLRRMTDDTGIFQHAFFTIPNYEEGYTTDDNARALLVSTLMQELGNGNFELTFRYLAFVWYSYNRKTGRFRNFMDYQRNWSEPSGSDDSHGRALNALGTVLGRAGDSKLPSIAGRLFEQALPAILNTSSPRAWAFALLGIHEYLQRFAGDRMASRVEEELSERLMVLYKKNNSTDWHWFEGSLSYCNAVIPHAILLSGKSLRNKEMIQVGLGSLEWLADLQRSKTEGGYFVPIGSNGFFQKGGSQSRFDQQPVEAQAMVSACLAAYRITQDLNWRKEARSAFEWFLGRNDLNTPVYDPTTGGCRDGLHPDRVNENQGAESTLAFLQSLVELRLTENVFIHEEL